MSTADGPTSAGHEQSALPKRREETSPDSPQGGVSAADSYHLVTDLVAGPNLRWRDNLFQAIFILVTVAILAGVGALLWGAPGAIGGALAGLIGGVIISGAILGIFRAYRHMQGRHK